MTEIDKIKNVSAFEDIKQNNINEQRAFQNQEADKVELSSKNRKKKVILGVAMLQLAATAGLLIYSIGRNPVKAAKVLKGNERISNKIYEEGNKFVDELMNKKGSFNTTTDDILAIFKKPKHKSDLSQGIEDLEKYFKENNIPEESDVVKAAKNLKKNLNKHLKQQEQNIIKDEKINILDFNEKFVAENKDDLQTIYETLGFQHYDLASKFNPNFASMHVQLNDYIKPCPNSILPNDGILFHGTTKSKGVYNTGFTPFASNQINSAARELGAGVYVTPDIRVASYFSGLHGSVIPVKMEQGANIAFVSENSYQALNNLKNKYVLERVPKEELEKMPSDLKNALTECLTNRFFKEAGYDGAYVPKGVKSGNLFANLFNPDINEVIGRKQSQVVVFSPEKLEIAPRTFKERVCDLKYKFEGIIAQIKYSHEHPFGF